MADTYLNLDDRKFLRSVAGGHVIRVQGGRIFQRSTSVKAQNGRREAKLARAVTAGWVEAEPDPTTGVYRLTEKGERDLAAREPEVRTS